MRKALAALATRSCNDSPLGKRTKCGLANQAANKAGFCILRLLEGFELPRAVVEIVEIVASLDRDAIANRAAGLGDGGCGFDAAPHRAGIDFARLPGGGDALRDGGRVGASVRREIKRRAAAEPLGLDAVDVAVPGQQDFGHADG